MLQILKKESCNSFNFPIKLFHHRKSQEKKEIQGLNATKIMKDMNTLKKKVTIFQIILKHKCNRFVFLLKTEWI